MNKKLQETINRGTYYREIDVNSGEFDREVEGDGTGVRTTTSFNCVEVKCGEESIFDCGNEFRGTNAPYAHNGEVNNEDVIKVNRGACDGKVGVDIGEFEGEFEGNGIGGGPTTSFNHGQVKCGEESIFDCGDEFRGTNAPYVHNREVNNEDFKKVKRGHVMEKLVSTVKNSKKKLRVME